MAHPLGRFKAKIIGATPTADRDGNPQLMLTFKTDFGSISTWMRLGGERGDQNIEITMRQLTVAGLPNEDLTQYSAILGKEVLIDVKETETANKTYVNVNIVDPDYVPQSKPFDQTEWKKLAARLKKESASQGEKLDF